MIAPPHDQNGQEMIEISLDEAVVVQNVDQNEVSRELHREPTAELEYHAKGVSKNLKPPTYTPVLLRMLYNALTHSTGDPREFPSRKFNLSTEKQPLLFIAITMYNEGLDEVALTVRGVCENLRALVFKTGDENIWKRVAICIVSDGREKANQKTLDYLKDIGVYDASKVTDTLKLFKSESIGAHLFENKAVFEDNPELSTVFPPLQMMFCLKEHNGGKLDSHWWFFEAFSQYLNPTYTFLLDVGTKPRSRAFFHIFQAFQRNPQIAGACGEITTRNLANFSPLVAAQHFEYKMAGILDKTLESLCGYISVLPGAFSAYRFKALQGAPLRAYFYHTEHKNEALSPFQANMYLAEDRILCFEIFGKANNKWTLHYISDSVAETDVPEDLVGLIKQRRRWINGSFFAMLYALMHFHRVIVNSSHSFTRKCVATLEFCYFLLNMVLSWFLLSIFIISLGYAADWAAPELSYVVYSIYGVLVIPQFIVAYEKQDVKEFAWFYQLASLLLGTTFIALTMVLLVFIFSNVINENQFSLLLTAFFGMGVYFAAAILHNDLPSVLLSFSQYWFYLPTYVIIFPIYALNNIDDCSWGTKDIQASVNNKFTRFKQGLLALWITTNLALLLVATIAVNEDRKVRYFTILLGTILAINGIRFLGSLAYWTVGYVTRRKERQASASLRLEYLKAMGLSAPKWEFSWVKFLTAPLDWRTWLAFSNLFIFSIVFGIPATLWCIASGALTPFFLLAFPVGPLFLAFFAVSWRALGYIEFLFNSVDGPVAVSLGIDASQIGREASVVPPIWIENASRFESCRLILMDRFTWRSVIYFAFIKPIMTIAFIVPPLILFMLVIVMLFHQSIMSGCEGVDGDFCKFYVNLFKGDWGNAEFIRWVFEGDFSIILRILLAFNFFLLCCNMLLYSDKLSRKLTSGVLGSRMMHLGHAKNAYPSH